MEHFRALFEILRKFVMSASVKGAAFVARMRKKQVKKALPIPTPAEQHAANLKRMEAINEMNREREARRIQKLKEADERERVEKAACEQRQRQLATEMKAFADAAGGVEDDITQAAKRVRRGPSIAEVPSYVKFLPAPDYEGRQTLKLVCTGAKPISSSVSMDAVKDLVREKLDTAVLCCTSPSSGIQRLHELATHADFPSPTHETYSDWMSWMSPSKWVDLVELRVAGNKGAFKSITSTGNYNEVLIATSDTPISDPRKWPCVLNLDDKKVVIRMTRSDSFGNTGSGNPLYRCISLDAMVNEMAMTLRAAACGFGVPVHAAVSWPWALQQGKTVRKYGLIMALDRADGDMISYQEAIGTKILSLPWFGDPSVKKRNECAYNKTCEAFAVKLMHRCYQMAEAGIINFDIKPGNILVNFNDNLESPDIFFADYDAVYSRTVDDSVAGVNVRFFVNLLLLSMHVRAYSAKAFVEPYVRCVAPVLIQLWELIQKSVQGKAPADFGEGACWVDRAEIAFSHKDGAFNHRKLRAMSSESERLSTQLRMMVYEYLFDSEEPKQPPPRATEWSKWKSVSGSTFFETKRLKVVPQLLRFIIFYESEVPPAWQELLDV